MTKALIDFDGSQLTSDEYDDAPAVDRSAVLEAGYAFGVEDHGWLAGRTLDGWWL